MINTNEVRVGNWLDISEASQLVINNGKGPVIVVVREQYGRVEAIEEKSILAGGFHVKESGKPIPITPEILKKAGFTNGQYHTGYFYHLDIGAHLVSGRDAEGSISFALEVADDIRVSEPFYYVHQLQNLFFALTGEELQINL
jgi:hypothetical protein